MMTFDFKHMIISLVCWCLYLSNESLPSNDIFNETRHEKTCLHLCFLHMLKLFVFYEAIQIIQIGRHRYNDIRAISSHRLHVHQPKTNIRLGVL